MPVGDLLLDSAPVGSSNSDRTDWFARRYIICFSLTILATVRFGKYLYQWKCIISRTQRLKLDLLWKLAFWQRGCFCSFGLDSIANGDHRVWAPGAWQADVVACRGFHVVRVTRTRTP